jgi:hypothetical protein
MKDEDEKGAGSAYSSFILATLSFASGDDS